MLLIGRTPDARRRRRIHFGDGGDLDIFHHARGVARAELRVLDLHGELLMDIAVVESSHRGLGKRQGALVERAGALAGETAHGKTVGGGCS